MTGLYLTPDQFTASFMYVPRVACTVLVVNRANQFLLTKRAIEPAQGMWHLPGSFLLKGEHIATCLERIATQELGFPLSARDCRLAHVSENIDSDPRGHVVDIIYKYRLLREISLSAWGDSAELGFFSSIPHNMGFNHAEILSKWYKNNADLP